MAALISPWNLPLYLLTFKMAPALACGNTVVCKASEMTSVTAWMLCRLINQAGSSNGLKSLFCSNYYMCPDSWGASDRPEPLVGLTLPNYAAQFASCADLQIGCSMCVRQQYCLISLLLTVICIIKFICALLMSKAHYDLISQTAKLPAHARIPLPHSQVS